MDLFSDIFTCVPSLRLADALTIVGAPVWNYLFDYHKASILGAAHAADLPFTFGTPEGAPFKNEWTAESQAISDKMQESFISFAHTGSPQTENIPTWPLHDSSSLPFMKYDIKTKVDFNFLHELRRAAWSEVPLTVL